MNNGFQVEENKSQGFIKIHRSFMNWEWYDDANTKDVFLHCLLRANHKPKKWHGQIIERGSFISSYAIIASELSLTVRKVRTAFEHLQKTEEIKIDGFRGLYSVFTINNYDIYQENDKAKINNYADEEQTRDNETTNQRQTADNGTTKDRQNADNETTTNKNEKNIKNEKNNCIAKSFFQKLIADDEECKKYSSFADSFLKFLQYKTDIKKQYKTDYSVRNAFLKFVRLSQNDVNYGVALVDNAIARGWQSIYDLSPAEKKEFQKNKQQSQANEVDEWESRLM